MTSLISPIVDVMTGEVLYWQMPNGLQVRPDNPIVQTLLTTAIESDDLISLADGGAAADGGCTPLLTGVQTPFPNMKLASILGSQNIEGYTSSIDSIRLSTKSNNPQIDEWHSRVDTLMGMFANGYKVIEFGSRGWVGQRIGPLQISWLKDKKTGHTIRYAVEVQGNSDGLVHQVLRFLGPMADRCSRIDMEITFVTKNHHSGKLPMLIHFDRERRQKKGLPLAKNGHPPRYGLQKEDGVDGDTFKIGAFKKKSRLKARIYNKEIQAGIERAYRYEVQLGQDYAQSMFEQLLAFYCAGKDIIPDQKFIAGVVVGYFSSKFVPVPEINSQTLLKISYKPRETTVERILRWLPHSVAPSVAFLLDMEVSLQTILEALGLDGLGMQQKLGVQTPLDMPKIQEILALAQHRMGFGRALLRDLGDQQRANVWSEFDRLVRNHFKYVTPLPELVLS